MARPKLTLFVDTVSPFAYFAFYMTKTSPIFKDCDVTYIPIFLGGVMKACGNTPPIQIKSPPSLPLLRTHQLTAIPDKAEWINLERQRWAKYCAIPCVENTPAGFPPSTLHVQRALCAVQLLHPDKLNTAIHECYNKFWVEGQAIQDPKNFGAALAKALGEDGAKEVMGKMGSAEVKGRLQENTDLAIREGAFGLPWFVATNAQGKTERFWGFDHLGQVIEHLGLQRGGELRAML
ncbi:hypothetical protein MBLNU457_g2905t1 [Dothideomycetes sp. NU457]